MSSGAYGSGGQKGVSAGRKAFSTILLLVLLVILAIELRAGLGVSLSEKALQEYSKDGIINGLTLAEAQSKMKLFPESAVDDSQPNETTIRYTWFSLLRPLIGKPQAVLHIVATRGDNPMAMSYHGELTEEDISALNPKSDPNAAPGALPKNGPVGAGMGGGGGMGAPGGMSRSRDPREEGRSRPEVEGEGEPAGNQQVKEPLQRVVNSRQLKVQHPLRVQHQRKARHG